VGRESVGPTPHNPHPSYLRGGEEEAKAFLCMTYLLTYLLTYKQRNCVMFIDNKITQTQKHIISMVLIIML